MTPKTLRKERKEKFTIILSKYYMGINEDVLNELLDAAESRSERQADERPSTKTAVFNMPIEWYIQHGLDIPEDLTRKNAEEGAALSAFESAFGIDRPWNWYPAKSTQEKEWRELRAYLVQLYEADPACFTGYAKWAGEQFSRGAKNASQIRSDPGCFPTAWAAYKASDMFVSTSVHSRNNEGKGFYG